MNVAPKKMIPWQDRERLGGTKAFFMTLFEALVSPVDYFEKLEVRENYQEPLVLVFYNSLYLAGPLISKMLFWVPVVGVIFILAATPILFFAIAYIAKIICGLFEEGGSERVSFNSAFYVLAFSSPAFILVYVPAVGYWLAAFVFVVLAGIGFTTVHNNINFLKIILVLIFVPLIVLIPFGTVRFTQDWQTQHKVVDSEYEAQKVLAAISIAAENYALKHGGQYPFDSDVLVNGPDKFIVQDYCGKVLYNYGFSCDFRGFGYYLRADPQGWKGKGKKIFYVTTGGKLREQSR